MKAGKLILGLQVYFDMSTDLARNQRALVDIIGMGGKDKLCRIFLYGHYFGNEQDNNNIILLWHLYRKSCVCETYASVQYCTARYFTKQSGYPHSCGFFRSSPRKDFLSLKKALQELNYCMHVGR